MRCWHLREDCHLCGREWITENEKDHDDESFYPNLVAQLSEHGVDVPMIKESELPADHSFSYTGVNTEELAIARKNRLFGASMGLSAESATDCRHHSCSRSGRQR
jgi:hypothetical protein